MSMVTEWRNARGESRWQPTTPNGETLCKEYLWQENESVWTDQDNHIPVLYRSKGRAHRIARRRARKSAAEELQDSFTRVSPTWPPEIEEDPDMTKPEPTYSYARDRWTMAGAIIFVGAPIAAVYAAAILAIAGLVIPR